MIDLHSFYSIRTALFVKILVPGSDALLFSNFDRPYSFGGDTYDDLGTLMTCTTTANELRPAAGTITIGISGIPNSRLQEIVNTRIKGSEVLVSRAFFNPATGAELSIPGNSGSNIVPRYRGRVMSIGISEDWDAQSASSSIVAQFQCACVVALFDNKVTGRRTNPTDQQALFPGDTSMSDVPSLANSNFNWGAPQ